MGVKETASRLIAKHGRAIEILRECPGVPDGYGGYLPGPITTYAAVALSATYATELQLYAGGLLGVGDRRVLVAVEGLAIKPTTDDRVRIDGTGWRTIRVSPLAPAGEVIFWEMQVRDDG